MLKAEDTAVRMTRYQLFLLGWVLLMVVGPAAFTQFPGGGFGGKGGGGKMKMDPAAFFNMYSGGADTFEVAKAQIPEFLTRFEPAEKTKERMMAFLQKKGVTNGVMTRDLFSEYTQESFREMGRRRAEQNFQKMSGGKDSFDVNTVQLPQEMTWRESAEQVKARMKEFLEKKGVKDGRMTQELYQEYNDGRFREFGERMKRGDKGGDRPPASDAEIEQRAREQFDAIDTNKDGKLTLEEVQAAQQQRVRGSRIAESFDKYDTNKDKAIDFEEYKAYVKDRMASRDQNRENKEADPGAPPAGEEDKRPTVYRFGKLPKELPTWFGELDTDQDAQVGLYEWKKAGKSVKEFLEMDTNGDGFVTAEEMLRYQKAQAKKKPADGTAAGVAFANNPAAGGGPPMMGAAPAGGFGGGEGMRGRFNMMGGGNKGGMWGGKRGGGNGMDFRKGNGDKGKGRGNRNPE